MNKMTWAFGIATAAVVVAAGGYYVYLSRTEVVNVELPSVSASPPPVPIQPEPPRPKPEHGEFNKRFEPKPPPNNGGRLN